VTLYWMNISHPSQVARRMLELKGVPYETVNVLPMNQRLHLRLAGFPAGTVPAIKLDGQRVQGTRAIGRALDARFPDPPLYPRDPAQRRRVEEAEAWGDQRLQPIPRRIFRYGAARDGDLRTKVMRRQGLPLAPVVAQLTRPMIEFYARVKEADGRAADADAVRADLAALPGLLDHADALLADGTLALDPPNAAALQILATVRVIAQFEDLAASVVSHPCAEAAAQVFPDYRAALPAFLPAQWLGPLRAAGPRA
jgi:glutathione S-transferase